MLDFLTKKQKIIFLIIFTFMIFIIIYYIYSTLYEGNLFYENNNLSINNLIDNNISFSENTNINSDTIVVYICGEVKESKVITLNKNSRICDAIDAVGGITSNADLTNINLAYILDDGEKIYIPKKGEETQNISNNYSSNKININKATQTELESIPGIGPSTALKIINYRKEKGKFLNIEDIKNISGIGSTKYEKIKEYITVK